MNLDFDAGKLLFSMPGKQDRWQVWEIKADGSGLRQVTPGDEPDVDNYDPCYLPDGRIIFSFDRAFQGVPCVGGSDTVANLCLMNADGTGIRQLCFDQDHDWCPTVLNNGRVLYTRWEYSDTPHYFTRLLFHMNPDGTGQMAYYEQQFLLAELDLLCQADPRPSHEGGRRDLRAPRRAADGRTGRCSIRPRGVSRPTGRCSAFPATAKRSSRSSRDDLVEGSWPKFLHPYPLSDKYFLVSASRPPQSKWGIYLVDVFDNMTLIKEEAGLRPVRADPLAQDAQAAGDPRPDRPRSRRRHGLPGRHLHGAGAEGRAARHGEEAADLRTALRLSGHGRAHQHRHRRPVGRASHPGHGAGRGRRLGQLPVPANTPVAVQPLDAEGKALQLMRSWFTAMPGESLLLRRLPRDAELDARPTRQTIASRRKPSEIAPWYGPARGFSFKREVQPVLDKYCVGCHKDGRQPHNGQAVPDFTAKTDNGWRNFTPSYIALHPFVRRPGPESDYHLQKPLEFHADTSELVQMLKRGTTTSSSTPRPGTGSSPGST